MKEAAAIRLPDAIVSRPFFASFGEFFPYKGYEDVVVQELRMSTDNVKFRKEKYYSPSTGQSFLAPLPPGDRCRVCLATSGLSRSSTLLKGLSRNWRNSTCICDSIALMSAFGATLGTRTPVGDVDLPVTAGPNPATYRCRRPCSNG